ncbi:MAG: tyrosine-protein phosphatase [Endomicrobiaceae bacterium]|nr:tyrosine-protein phosphatase [Endomicrobiaceae bacterium]
MIKKITKLIILFFTCLIIITGLYFSYNWISGNFHTITIKQAYRSKQLSKKQFEHYIKKYDIKSILNLRGSEPGIQWYEDEIAVSKAYGVEHYDLEIHAMELPDDKDMTEIINILKSAQRPILIHCLGGADRSGLVSAIWKIVIEKESKEKASKQLSVFYGHMPFGRARAMDRWLAKYRIDSDSGKIIK